MSKIEAYECESCGKLLKPDSENLRTVYGNICVGLQGGIVGNNLKDSVVFRDAHYCTECLITLIQYKPVSRSSELFDEDSIRRS